MSHSSKARIEQQLDAFAGRQLALLVLAVDTLLATAEAGQFALFSSWRMMSCIKTPSEFE
jgi:hypothetical protein